MSTWGMDVAGLQAVAADLDRYAASIDRSRRNVDGMLARTPWYGQNADAFRGRWRTIAARDLDGLRAELTSAATDLRRQAQEQLTASSRRGGGAGRSGGQRRSPFTPRDAALLNATMLLYPGLAAAYLAWMYPPDELSLRAVYAPDPGTAGVNLAKFGLEAVGKVITPVATTERFMLGAGAALAFVGTGIGTAFDRWGRDASDDMTTGERATRATTAGVAGGFSGLGGKLAGIGATKAVLGGAKLAGLAAAGTVAAPVVGVGVAIGVTYALTRNDGFRDGTAAVGSFVYDTNKVVNRTLITTATNPGLVVDAAERAVDVARSGTRAAGEILDAVGGSVGNAFEGARARIPLLGR